MRASSTSNSAETTSAPNPETGRAEAPRDPTVIASGKLSATSPRTPAWPEARAASTAPPRESRLADASAGAAWSRRIESRGYRSDCRGRPPGQARGGRRGCGGVAGAASEQERTVSAMWSRCFSWRRSARRAMRRADEYSRACGRDVLDGGERREPLLTARSTSRRIWCDLLAWEEKTRTMSRHSLIAPMIAAPQSRPGRMSRGAIQHRTPRFSSAAQTASATGLSRDA